MSLLTKEHLYSIQSVANPVLAPSNEEAVFTRTLIDEEDNKYYSHIFHVSLATHEVTQWTFGKERVSQVTWSPDGKKIAFLSNRNEVNQLFILNKNGGEAQAVTTLANGVTNYAWSPCGEKIWLTSAAKAGQLVTDKEEKEDNKKPEAYVVHEMKYKMDGAPGYGLRKQHTYQQIALLTVATKEVEQFTTGDYSHHLVAVSQDGKELVVSVNRTDNQDFDFRTPLYLVDVETKAETVLTEEEGYFGEAAYSYDNRYIAYVGAEQTFKNATHPAVYIYDRETRTTQNLTAAFDAPVGDVAVADTQQGVDAPAVMWTAANDLYFQVSTMGDVRLYYATLDGAIYPASPEDEHVYGYAIKKDGNGALITVSNPTFPGELFDYDITTGERIQLTSFNANFLQEVALSKPEPIVYTSKDGLTVHGWLLKPTAYTEGEKYPLIVEIHGGPHAMYANTFFHELQLLAAQGYGVLYTNPRGSHGYSQDFVNGVRGDYGGGDYEDIMAGLDYVLAENNWIDETRLGVTGGSYGGFMTNWIVGHTNRFKAAVTQRSISNWISFFGTSDIGYYFSEWQHFVNMKDVEKLWHHSPLKYAENIETPILILHGEMDFRCPIADAEQFYITLKTLNKEAGFVRFPQANHNLSRNGIPNLRLERLNQIVSWFERYV